MYTYYNSCPIAAGNHPRCSTAAQLEETAQGRLVLGLVVPARAQGGDRVFQTEEKQGMNTRGKYDEGDEKKYISDDADIGTRTGLASVSPTVPPLPSDEDSEKEPDEREHGSIFKSTGTRRAQLLLTSKDIIDDEDCNLPN